MARMIICCFLLTQSLLAWAQQNRFIYIQTENKQPFYIKLDKKLYSSAASGYVIIPQLTDGSYNLQVGFPKSEWPEQAIQCKVDKKDAGFLLKNFGEKGWGLFNMQTLEVLMAGNARLADNPTAENKKDEFSNLLSNVVNDPTIKQAPVKPEPPKTAPPVGEPVAQPVTKTPPVAISRLLYVNSKEGAEMIFTDKNEGQTDTIRILIPVDKSAADQPAEPKEPVAVQEKKPEPPVQKEETPIVTQPPVEKEAPQPVKEEKKPAKEQFINMELPNPAVGEQPKTTPQEAAPTKKVSMINSNCRNHANQDDFMKLRKKMAAEDNDDDMVDVARKVFKTKCFTTEQIKNLGVLFLKDEGRYRFFDAAYPYVSDTDHFPGLESLLTDPYQINRFRAMIKR